MEPRMTNPAQLLPAAARAVMQLHASSRGAGVPDTTLELLHLRVSQINGCSYCIDAGVRSALAAGETSDRLFAVSAWRHVPFFTDPERAALDLAESVTRLSDRPDPVPDAIWAEAARHYDENQLAALLIAIATTNVFNRVNVPIRQPPGASY